jgi:catechol 2,3-dioxygenase-like lactoylglutathione lyase family enzyme
MPANVFHHVGLRVADIERAARFYIEAFDGRWQTRPRIREGRAAQVIMATPNARFLVCHIAFDTGTIELFQFLDPVHPMAPAPPAQGNLIHFGIQVPDVPATLERVERAGGTRFWPEIRPLDEDHEVIYVSDPDGNVIEVIDASVDEVVDILIERDPAAAPQ